MSNLKKPPMLLLPDWTNQTSYTTASSQEDYSQGSFWTSVFWSLTHLHLSCIFQFPLLEQLPFCDKYTLVPFHLHISAFLEIQKSISLNPIFDICRSPLLCYLDCFPHVFKHEIVFCWWSKAMRPQTIIIKHFEGSYKQMEQGLCVLPVLVSYMF